MRARLLNKGENFKILFDWKRASAETNQTSLKSTPPVVEQGRWIDRVLGYSCSRWHPTECWEKTDDEERETWTWKELSFKRKMVA